MDINCGDVILLKGKAWNVEGIDIQNGILTLNRWDSQISDIREIRALISDVSTNPNNVCCDWQMEAHAYMSGKSVISTLCCNYCGFYSERMH